MVGIISKYLFLLMITVIFVISIFNFLYKKSLIKYSYVLLSTFLVFWIVIFYSFILKDVKEYKSFNCLLESNVIRILINNKEVDENKNSYFLNDLKNENFTWSNHPNILKTDTITVYTKQRFFKFIVNNTSNQGVLVKRINQKGSDYVTNRNDNLLKYVE